MCSVGEEANGVDRFRTVPPGMYEFFGNEALLRTSFFVEVDINVPWCMHVRPPLVVILLRPIEFCSLHVGKVFLVIGIGLGHSPQSFRNNGFFDIFFVTS